MSFFNRKASSSEAPSMSTCAICGHLIYGQEAYPLKWDGTTDANGNKVDEYVCGSCLKRGSLEYLPTADTTADELQQLISERSGMASEFSPTRTIDDGRLELDEAHELFRLDGKLFCYDELAGFKLLEDKFTAVNYYNKSASTFTSRRYCNLLEMEVCIQGPNNLQMSIPLISKPIEIAEATFLGGDALVTDKNACNEFKEAMRRAQKYETALGQISAAAKSHEQAAAAPFSAADEIRKFKELADEGIITQEEFEAKKRQLLA